MNQELTKGKNMDYSFKYNKRSTEREDATNTLGGPTVGRLTQIGSEIRTCRSLADECMNKISRITNNLTGQEFSMEVAPVVKDGDTHGIIDQYDYDLQRIRTRLGEIMSALEHIEKLF